jgi:hypothetical protein
VISYHLGGSTQVENALAFGPIQACQTPIFLPRFSITSALETVAFYMTSLCRPCYKVRHLEFCHLVSKKWLASNEADRFGGPFLPRTWSGG